MPDVHFTWTITVGNLLTVVGFLLTAHAVGKVGREITIFLAEHDYVVKWIADQQGISREELSMEALRKRKTKKKEKTK